MDEATSKALARATNDVSLTLMNAISGVQAANSGNVKAQAEMPENHKRFSIALFTWTLALVDAIAAEGKPKIEIARKALPGEKIN